MSLLGAARVARLLVRLSKADADADLPPVLARKTASGTAYDLFLPRGRPVAAVVAVHGVTLNGKDDHRLQHFARSLASSGVACAVLQLGGLSTLNWYESDVDELAAVAGEVRREVGLIPGLLGFSFGGSIALLAAVRAQVKLVLAIGAVHSFETLYEEWFARGKTGPSEDRGWDAWIYVAAIMAWRRAAMLGLDADERTLLERFLREYCSEESLEKKRAFFDRHLAHRAWLGTEYREVDRAALKAISPAGKLSALKCPTGILHDEADWLVVPRHAQAISEELRASAGGSVHRLLITPLLGHVTLRQVAALADVAALVKVLAPLVEDSPP